MGMFSMFSPAFGAIKSTVKAHPTASLGTAVVGGLVGQGLYRRHQNNKVRRIINGMSNSHGYLQSSKGNIVAGY